MFQKGDKVEFVNYPNLKGTVREIMPAVDDLPEEISVDVFIPAGEPGFNFTGITENFWCGPESLRANKGLQRTWLVAPAEKHEPALRHMCTCELCVGKQCAHQNTEAVNGTIVCKDCGNWL